MKAKSTFKTKGNTILTRTSKVGINIIILMYSIFCVFPIIWMVYSSMKTQAEFNTNLISLPSKINLSNYFEAFKVSNMGLYSINSFTNAVLSTLIVLILAFIIGYFLARFTFKGSKIIFMLFMFGMLIPIHALLVPIFIQFKSLGLFDKRFTLIIPYVAFGLPFAVFLCTTYIKNIPIELEEAAVIDRARFHRRLFLIIFPVCKPILVTIGILQFFSNWNEFPFALVLINSRKYKTIPIGLQNFSGQYGTNYPLLMAGLVLATLPLIIFYIFYNKKIIEGMTSGAVKG